MEVFIGVILALLYGYWIENEKPLDDDFNYYP